MLFLFFSSSVVEQMAVNHLVVGSNPTWGGIFRIDVGHSTEFE